MSEGCFQVAIDSGQLGFSRKIDLSFKKNCYLFVQVQDLFRVNPNVALNLGIMLVPGYGSMHSSPSDEGEGREGVE